MEDSTAGSDWDPLWSPACLLGSFWIFLDSSWAPVSSSWIFLGPLDPLFTFFFGSLWTQLGFLDSDFSWDLHGLPSFLLASLSVLVDSFWVHLGFFLGSSSILFF